MKKQIIFMALLVGSGSAFAQAPSFDAPDIKIPQALINPFVRMDIHDLAASPGDEKAALDVQDMILKSPGSARTAFRVWSEDEKQGEYAAWPEVGMNMLRWLEPSRGFDWKHGTRVPGSQSVAYQQDSLVDLERTMAVNVTIPTTIDEGYGYAVYDTERGPLRVPATSKSLMAQGYAPIGPDNVPVLLCKLGFGNQAPYIELSKTQQIRFQESTGLRFSICLAGGDAQVYWKTRYSDFMDSYHDITNRHAPAGSY